MPEAAHRLKRWQAASGAWDASADADASQVRVLDAVRSALDDDLDTPCALRMLDDAADAGRQVGPAAALLGVDLSRP
jgi:L-cysteine:1D-myo-inositol 2-amino-2-deoxy-alpha-D-glucopyranoside ligase